MADGCGVIRHRTSIIVICNPSSDIGHPPSDIHARPRV